MIYDNVQMLRERIDSICIKEGIKDEVTLCAVSKMNPLESIIEALHAGIKVFGENRVQEAFAKFNNEDLLALSPELHIIGHLQRNKARDAVSVSTMIQSIHKIATLEAVEKQCIQQNKEIDYLIEINISKELNKEGIFLDDVEKLLEEIEQANFGKVHLRGLMTIGPLTDDRSAIRRCFRQMKNKFETLQAVLKREEFAILSMGMSGDYDIAIEEGSNFCSSGFCNFWARNY